MLKIIYGHSGSGKSTLIYNMMKKDATEGKRSYLIVPEQETVSCERALIDILPQSAQLTSEVLNFSRLANLIFRHYGGLSYNYADKGAKTLIMWKNLRELMPLLAEYSKSAEGTGITRLAEDMLSTVGELKAYCVSPQKLDRAAEKLTEHEILKNKLRDLSLIMSAYSGMLEECYSDAADDLTKLTEKLKGHDFFAGANVYIDSFTSFTRQEKDVIEEILKSADNLTVALPIDSVSTSQIHYESSADTALYIRHIAERSAVNIEEIHLGSRRSGAAVMNAISEFLWDHSVSDLDLQDEGNIKIIEACDPYEEADAVASTVRGLLMNGMRCRDIAIIARDASLYRGIIDIALEKADIPYFFSQSSDIMSKAPIKFLISALKIKIRGWRREDVMEYLKSELGGFDRHSVDMLECYADMWNIRGNGFTGDDFTMNPDGYSEYLTERGKEILAEVNALKNEFVPSLLKLFARLDNAQSASEMCRAIYLFAEENKLSETLKANAEAEYSKGKRKEASESLQIYNVLIRSLDSLAKVLGDEQINVKEFYESLKIMLDSTAVGSIPTAEDQVTVGSASMLRTSNIKCAIVIGLNEGEFPQSIKDSAVFSDNDKKILEKFDISLSANSSTRASDELFYVYRAMSAPSEKLILTYHTASFAGEKAFPSMAIERIKKLFPKVKKEVYSLLPPEVTMLAPALALEKLATMPISPYAKAIRDYLSNSNYSDRLEFSDIPSSNAICELSKNTSNEIFGTTLGLTQTLIDNYSSCPFEYMCSKLLSINDTTRAEFDYSNFGTYVHYILENFLKISLEDGKIGNEPDRSYISAVIDNIADDYFAKVFSSGAYTDQRLLHRFERMRRLAVLVAIGITKEFSDSSFRPAFFELSLGRYSKELYLPPLVLPIDSERNVSLSGKIDRVDILRKNEDVYVRVVDYKTGAKTFSFGDLKKAKNIQLPLYLFSLCDEEQTKFKNAVGCSENGKVLPAGAMYFSSLISPIEISDERPIASVKDIAEMSFERSGFLLNDEEILLEMSRSFSKDILCGISKNKKGGLSGNAGVSADDMHTMNEELKNTVCGVADSIMTGKMSPSPSFEGKTPHCDSCSMKTICRSAQKFKG